MYNRETNYLASLLAFFLCIEIYNAFITLFSYILYDMNPPEGFNLRRDVYVRIAVFLKGLAKRDKEFRWHLVLPPWGKLEICF